MESPCFAYSETPESDAATWNGHCGDRDWGPVVYACVAQKIERERDEARRLHAYVNEQRKAADHERMNAEETVARLRARVDDLLRHGKDACEYTDGWEDALLKVRNEFSHENDQVQP